MEREKGIEERGKKGKKIERRKEGVRVGFWNVVWGFESNKDKECWESLKEWEVVVLMQTWLDRKGWERWRWL